MKLSNKKLTDNTEELLCGYSERRLLVCAVRVLMLAPLRDHSLLFTLRSTQIAAVRRLIPSLFLPDVPVFHVRVFTPASLLAWRVE